MLEEVQLLVARLHHEVVADRRLVRSLRPERRIRKDYIEAVRVYNTELKTFPGVFWAATFFRSNKPMAEFTANESSQTPPVVKF